MMMRMITRGRSVSALLVLFALMTGPVGPCLCAPSVGDATHDCCRPEPGLRAASPDCCTTRLAPLRAPEATFRTTGAALTVPVVVALPRIATAVPAANVVFRDRSPETSTPPPAILRI